jgi:hypothetical protein
MAEPLTAAVDGLPGVVVTRMCAEYGPDPEGTHRFECAFVLDCLEGHPTPAAWSSLTFLAEVVSDAVIGGRSIELSIFAIEGVTYYSLDGDLSDMTPNDLAEWLTDLRRVTS